MDSVAETLIAAVAHHQAGRLGEAEQLYRQVLADNPAHADATHLLGLILLARGERDAAVKCIRDAIRLDGRRPAFHVNLAKAHQLMGNLDEAALSYERALAIEPNLAEAHFELGAIRQARGELPAAIACYRRASELVPDDTRALNNLGNVYRLQTQTAAAKDCYQSAIALKPQSVDANNNLGSLLQIEGDLEGALACYRRALQTDPDFAPTYVNLGNAYQEMGQLDEALACYERTLQLQPEDAEAHFNRALIYLTQERLADGWREFGWRLKCRYYPKRTRSEPLWEGGSFAGQTLLVHAEQGFGDTLQFVRYLEAVKRLGGAVILEVQPGLLRLVRDSGFTEAVAAGSGLPPIDLHAPLLQLPAILRTTPDNLPAKVPYLAAEPRLVELWRERFEALEGFKVGIVWQGNRQYAYDRRRSIALAHFAPLAAIAGVRLISLQKGDGSEQLAEVAGRFEVLDLGAQLDGGPDAFVDTAAVMKHLDLVITSDTASAHLAGALGTQVWVALSDVPEWRWFLAREDSPWYPTMRLFRQSARGDWSGVFARMAGELARIV